jgi:hypothetical protein
MVFIKSEYNDADVLTKNTAEEIYMRHTKKLIPEITDEYEEKLK